MGGVPYSEPSSRSDEPASRPTALKIPPQVPLMKDGGAAGGSAVGCTGDEGCKKKGRARSTGGRCDRFPGAAAARRSTPNSLKAGVPAARVTSSPRLARGPSRLDHLKVLTSQASALQAQWSTRVSGLEKLHVR